MSESLRGGSHATPAKGRPGSVEPESVPEPEPEIEVEVDEVDDADGEEEDLSEYTTAALRVIAQDLDVSGYTRLKKTELVVAIKAMRARP